MYYTGIVMKGGKLSNTNIFNSILLDLRSIKGVKMLELAGRDGFLMGEHGSDDSEMLTLMSAAMLKAAETATCRLGNECPNHVVVDYNGGKIIAVNAGQKAMISVVAEQDASLEPILSELERTALKIRKII